MPKKRLREQQQQPEKRQKLEYIYGNYAHYYGYRVGRALEEDPRLSVFQREWIEGKDCLDIGCNEGYVTIAVAERFGCKSMLGVDIDSSLIGKARRNLNRELEGGEVVAGEGINTEVERSSAVDDAKVPGNEVQDNKSAESNDAAAESFPSREELLSRVTFKTQNYLDTAANPGRYDTILCLSISKWIHLNWGDEGLLKFFAKIFQELRPGGCLVLEPQPWTSYVKKHKVSKVARENFQTVLFRPEDFPTILTEKIGFKSYKQVSSEVPSDKTGFRRPLFVYHK